MKFKFLLCVVSVLAVELLVLPNGFAQDLFTIREAGTANDHSCALSEKGEIYCWGLNTYGQLGLGHKRPVLNPEKIPFFTSHPAKHLIVAEQFNCAALAADDSVWCWGIVNYGTTPGATVTKVSDGIGTVVGMYEFGWNLCVNVMTSPASSSVMKCRVVMAVNSAWWESEALYSGSEEIKIQASGGNKTSLHRDGTVWTRGTDSNLKVQAPLPVIDIAGDDRLHGNILLLNDGTVWEGSGADWSTFHPHPAPLGERFVRIFSGTCNLCAETESGQLFCRGRNEFGQLAYDGSTDGETNWIPMLAVSQIKSMTFADEFMCAVFTSGLMKCWGRGLYGVLGNGAQSNLGGNPGESLENISFLEF